MKTKTTIANFDNLTYNQWLNHIKQELKYLKSKNK